MKSGSLRLLLVGLLLLGFTIVGCGRGSLKKLRTLQGCPWCAPNRQVQVGQRSMGQSFYGDILKDFWLDHTGHEYDPEDVSNKVWEYLKTTGDVAKIDAARHAGKCCPEMRIVSVDPIVVIQIPCQHKRFAGSKYLISHGTKLAIELAYFPSERLMYFDEPMQWLSPDLKKGPTTITFSHDGVADIPLKSGKLKLVKEGEFCKVSRE